MGGKWSFSRIFEVVFQSLALDFEIKSAGDAMADQPWTRAPRGAHAPSSTPPPLPRAALPSAPSWSKQRAPARSPSLPLPFLLSLSVLPRLNAGERLHPPWSLAELRGHRSSTQP